MSRIDATQSRMARAALQWSIADLAEHAQVSTNTIIRLERGEALMKRTASDIRRALETAGVEFIDKNGGGPGARLRKRDEDS